MYAAYAAHCNLQHGLFFCEKKFLKNFLWSSGVMSTLFHCPSSVSNTPKWVFFAVICPFTVLTVYRRFICVYMCGKVHICTHLCIFLGFLSDFGVLWDEKWHSYTCTGHFDCVYVCPCVEMDTNGHHCTGLGIFKGCLCGFVVFWHENCV